ncbi:MAG: S9 family peptidase [Sphingomicrobium sp.]
MRIFAVIGCAIFAVATPIVAQPVPTSTLFEARDLFQLQLASDPQVRPDGRMIAYVRSSGDIMADRMSRSIWLIDVASGKQQPLAAVAGQHSSPRWSPDGQRLAYISTPDGEKSQLMVRWLSSGQSARVAVLAETPANISWSPDGSQLAFVMFTPGKEPKLGSLPDKPEGAKWADPLRFVDQLLYRTDAQGALRPGTNDIYVVAADGGAPRRLTNGEIHDDSALAFSPDGRFLYYGANTKADWARDTVESEVWRLPVAGGAAVALTDRDGPDSEPTPSPDGRMIAYTGYDDRRANSQDSRLYVMNADGSGKRQLAVDLDRPVSNPQWSGDGRSIYIQYMDRGIGRIGRVTLDGRVAEVIAGMAASSLDRPYSGGDYSFASGTIAYTLGDAQRPSDIAVLRSGKSTRLTDLNAGLIASKSLAAIRPLPVTSTRDGRAIDAWLVLPPTYQPGQRLPLILEIHGGPAASYGPYFATDMQLYAAAGYAVVYPNARLSTSYGEAFSHGARGTDPFPDYEDFMSTVDAAIAAGIADPNNVFVTGGSYGGYASAAIIGKTDRFRAAALQKPVINWVSKILNTDISAYQYEYTYGKQPWDNPELLWKNSPLSLVGNVKTPTLIVVGEKDYRTPVSESEQYYGALQLRGIPTSLVIVPGANHGGLTARPSQSAAKAAAIIAWFDRYKTQASQSQ